jgi:hypothetical protein
MKKRFLVLLLAVSFGAIFVGNASAYLMNWGFNPSGTGYGAATTINIQEYFDITGTAAITNDYNTLTFGETGNFIALTHDGGVAPAGGVISPSLSATFTATGNIPAIPNGGFDFSTGTLTVLDGFSNVIGTFDLVSGSGALLNYAPNGEITTNFVADSLASGYWFAPDGTDLSAWTQTNNSPILSLGIATTNASILSTPTPTTDAQGRLATFSVSDNGQFRINVVPEPTTLLLFGIGLFGMAAIGRKKLFKR